MPIQTSEIEFEASGRPHKAYLASPAGGGPGLLVLPSWWGLKLFFKQVCDQLAEHGYTALAPDYYQGQVGSTIEAAQTLQEAAESDLEAMAALVTGAKDQLASLRPGQPLGIVGFSMGTDWAVITANHAPEVAATVLFYGSYYYNLDFSQMKSKVLGHYAEKDKWQPFEMAQEMAQNMQAAGVEVTLYRYPGTAHWFMEADRPEYALAAATLAWERTYEFLAQALRER